jgi:hypothetical protein
VARKRAFESSHTLMRAGATALRTPSRQGTFDVPRDWASCDKTHELAMQMSAQLQQSTQESAKEVPKMAEAILTLSQALDRANRPNADDFTVGLRVKAHPATDTFMRGMSTGLSTTLVSAQSDWCWSRWIAVASELGLPRAICFMLANRPHQYAVRLHTPWPVCSL